MIFIYKNRGILIPIYIALPIIAIVIIKIVISSIFDLNLAKINFNIAAGIGLFFSALWIYLVKDDSIKVDGKRKKIFIGHHFYYLSLHSWSYIVFFIGVLTIISGLFEMYDLI